MIRYFPGIIALMFLYSCNSNNEQQAKNTGREIYFDQSTYDFGEMEEDSDGRYTIEFKNIGDSAIVINRVRSSCGCTIPSWPKKPVEPGESGTIEVRYNTALTGSFMKSVYVYSSAGNSPVKLIVKGKVVPKNKT
ncbi:MAG: DUF1573 domain-containing protein [Bacteroidales bacterium]|nr:DUF1573 domain-containing protein [Bacteroidales bacterium]